MAARHPQSIYRSGECEIDIARREVRIGSTPAPVGGRTMEVLEALLRPAGDLITKENLVNTVWPGAIVPDNTLQVHISAIRKALGPHRALLKTESGRGYRLVGDWTVRQEDAAKTGALDPLKDTGERPKDIGETPPTNLPVSAISLIGRAESIQQLQDLLSAYRAVTLTGPGGIGKTILALEVGRVTLPRFRDGGWLVELAALSDANLVPAAVVAVLDLRLSSEGISAEAVARAVGDRNLLLVLDNCEHVIDAAAGLAETILRLCPHATVLATTREVLRIGGEYVFRVSPLEVPPSDLKKPEEVLGHSAVELFVARARAQDSAFALDAANVSTIAAICRHLDGIPLAIEFAAASTATLGVAEVAARLEDRFHLLTSGRRTALPRHQTLRAALDWSYHLLPESERLLLRHLAVFRAGFTVDAAIAVMKDATFGPLSVTEGIANLVAKSLVGLAKSDAVSRWSLLETVRAYALEKLAEHNEADKAGSHQAAYFRDLFADLPSEPGTRHSDDEWARRARELDNVRAALDWAFSPRGDASIGVALTVTVVPLWMQLSLMEECRSRVEQALSAIAPEAGLDPRCQMNLLAALSASLMYTRGAVSDVATAGAKALEIAESLDDAEYQLRSLFGLWSFHINSGQQGVALSLAERFDAVAAERSEPSDRLVGERMIGTSRYYIGDLGGARRHLERVLDQGVAAARRWQIVRFEVDQWAAARAYLARILWLQGLPHQAMRTAEASVTDARATDHAISLCLALALAACPIALFIGDLILAEQYVDMLLDHSTTHALARWHAFGRSYRAMLVIQRGDLATGLRLLRAAFGEPAGAGSVPRFFTRLMAETLGRAGQVVDGLVAIEEAIVHSERSEERWLIAELLRIKGDLVLLQGTPGAAAAAEGLFRQALDRAHRQGALALELRCAMSLARLWRNHSRAVEAGELLVSVYDRFTEGFDTVELKAAKALIEALS